MKSLVVYSSRTGNTRKVANAVFDSLPGEKEIFPVEQAPPANGYDFVAIGFWVDKGRPDDQAAAYMKTVQDTPVGLFGTLGAKPDSPHARDCIRRAGDLVTGSRVAGTFLCQGRIAPAVVEMMIKTASHVHPMTPERMANIKAAESHPDDADLEKAQVAFREMIRNIDLKEIS